MTKTVEAQLKRFFSDYAAASLGGDAAKVAAAYEDSYIETGPGAVCAFAVDKDYKRKLAKKSEAMTGQFGLKDLEIKVDRIDAIAPLHFLVHAQWTMQFEPADRKPITSRFRISYVVRVADDPKILLAISHEDEAAVMKRDGLL